MGITELVKKLESNPRASVTYRQNLEPQRVTTRVGRWFMSDYYGNSLSQSRLDEHGEAVEKEWEASSGTN
jgi:hypothetical protein